MVLSVTAELKEVCWVRKDFGFTTVSLSAEFFIWEECVGLKLIVIRCLSTLAGKVHLLMSEAFFDRNLVHHHSIIAHMALKPDSRSCHKFNWWF